MGGLMRWKVDSICTCGNQVQGSGEQQPGVNAHDRCDALCCSADVQLGCVLLRHALVRGLVRD